MNTFDELKEAFPGRDLYVVSITRAAKKWVSSHKKSIAMSMLHLEGIEDPTEEQLSRKENSVLMGLETEYALNCLKGQRCLREWKKRALSGVRDPGYDHPADEYEKKWDAKTSSWTHGSKHIGDYMLYAPAGLRADIYLQFVSVSDKIVLIGYASAEMLKDVKTSVSSSRYPKRLMKFSQLLPTSDEIASMLRLNKKL